MNAIRWITGLSMLMTATAQAAVTKASWGKTPDGQPVELYTLAEPGLTVRVTTFGARIVGIETPDRYGVTADVALGYSSLSGYEADKSTYVGAIVGRYGNRIAKGRFTIDGVQLQIPANNNGNALHGGTTGLDRKVWSAKEINGGVEMTHVSPDGDMGFPGELTIKVRYVIAAARKLTIDYEATTTKPTVVNLTNHAYFNLAGEGSGDILGHELVIAADSYTPVDAQLIPTGKLEPVKGTPFDFTNATPIGKRIGDAHEQLKRGNGYDHNYVLKGTKPAAIAYDPKSGRTLTVETTEPGVQLYTGNFLDGKLTGKAGKAYTKNFGFCLETQHYPDSPNQPSFPSTIVRPGTAWSSTTSFEFGVRK